MSKQVQPLVKVLQKSLRNALRSGKLDDARHILGRLKANAPTDKETRGFELEVLLAAAQMDEAKALAAQLVQLYPGSGRVLFLAGRLHYGLKEYATAEDFFRESLKIFSSPLTEEWLGRTLTQIGKFSEAHGFLDELVKRKPSINRDLAWLCEREGDLEGAIRYWEKHESSFPGSGKAQIVSLKARLLEPVDLFEEVDNMLAVDGAVDESVFPVYIERLFDVGEGTKARAFLGKARISARCEVNVAWICYRAAAYDLAYDLFLTNLAGNVRTPAFRSALEKAAKMCHRLEQLVAKYEELAGQHKFLWGRIRALKRRIEQVE